MISTNQIKKFHDIQFKLCSLIKKMWLFYLLIYRLENLRLLREYMWDCSKPPPPRCTKVSKIALSQSAASTYGSSLSRLSCSLGPLAFDVVEIIADCILKSNSDISASPKASLTRTTYRASLQSGNIARILEADGHVRPNTAITNIVANFNSQRISAFSIIWTFLKVDFIDS